MCGSRQTTVTHLLHAGKLTDPVGKALAEFPVEPWMGKVLLAGAELGCSQEALIVVAMAATDPVWLTPRSHLMATPSNVCSCTIIMHNVSRQVP